MRLRLSLTPIPILVAALAAAGAAARAGEQLAAPFVPTFETGKQPTVEIHVALDGRDDTGDGSAANPYASIERAAQLGVAAWDRLPWPAGTVGCGLAPPAHGAALASLAAG